MTIKILKKETQIGKEERLKSQSKRGTLESFNFATEAINQINLQTQSPLSPKLLWPLWPQRIKKKASLLSPNYPMEMRHVGERSPNSSIENGQEAWVEGEGVTKKPL